MSEERPLFRTPFPGSPRPEVKTVSYTDRKYLIPRPDVFTTPEEELKWIRAEKAEIQRRRELPFLYGWKWYPWAREFFESRNHVNLLCAANQISKSSTQIRKAIHWATATNIWSELWDRDPIQFWYLYPTKAQATAEFETKWKLFLPKGEMQDDPVYGWKPKFKGGDILGIIFNSGVHLYFKTYEQQASALQTGTCDALFCDEELPVEIYEELMFRISASNGYFHMVFTATLGQDFWRRAMEPGSTEKEELPTAYKKTVSLYEAQFFEDGSPSHWTDERIKIVEARCSTHNEVLKRVHGKFIVIGGRKYEAFDIKRHMKTPHPLPPGWLMYAGADIGGGGAEAHKSAICYVAVRPDFRAGRVFKAWRGDFVETTSGDVVEKHLAMKKEAKIQNFAGKYYDWGNKDFGTIASRMGEPFEKAEKGHDIGEDVINTLFKNDMLFIYEDAESTKLGQELAVLRKDQNKRTAKDDLSDALRYCVTKIPWDWNAITGEVHETEDQPEESLNATQQQIKDRRSAFERTEDEREKARVQEEFDEINQLYGG